MDRRSFVAGCATGLVAVQATDAFGAEGDSQLFETWHPKASDGYEGLAFIRKPARSGPFPAVVLIHGGVTTYPQPQLESLARASTATRLVDAGYLVAVTTYRSRDEDPLSPAPINDCVATYDAVSRRRDVVTSGVAVWGCSGGADLALEVAATRSVSAVVAEEPASMMFTGVFDSNFPKAGPRFTPQDSFILTKDPLPFYKPEHRARTRAKLAKIKSPVLIQEAEEPVDPASAVAGAFNNGVLIPEMRAIGSRVRVLTYGSQPHCFCFYGDMARSTPMRNPPKTDPEVALQAWRDAEAFIRSALPSAKVSRH